MGNNVQFHAIIQLSLGGVLGFFSVYTGQSHSLPELFFNFTKYLAACSGAAMGIRYPSNQHYILMNC
jgi:hypothetical protein